ncbi:dihydrofolate reductase family protein [Tenggerimyces flavus]|uniref:Dihydrofolate reductase family protein n=1 Tax=Tenggerimyces flavus TaxID=1708749 RepID=A0ABV7YNP9_9ACTN|nr:dihydrofolate reductase family protein [Tenggerimyces flavus]MBM7784385.1 dihydrofolate reductase [Tenggerimyces flavus]
MRKLVYLIASTIDGFIAEADRSDPTGKVFLLEGDHGPVLTAEYPEMVPGHWREAAGLEGVENKHFDTVLEGRVSYTMALAEGVENAYPHMRHLVFSTTLEEVPDKAIELVSTDPLAKVRELKSESGKDIWLCGGGALAASLREEIDEIHLKLNPVSIGTGAPIFDGPFQINRWTVESTRAFDSGVVLIRYVRA